MLAVLDPGLLFGQFLLFYPIEVLFFLGHGSFKGRVLPSGVASRSSWVDVSTVVRVIRLVDYIQVDALDFFSFVAPGRRWKVFCSWLCTWLERFIRVLASGSLVRVCSSIARSLEIKSSTAAGSCGPVQGFAPGLHR